jgi:hypothetical protein
MDKEYWRPAGELRGLTRRKPDAAAPDGYVYTWAVQQRFEGPMQGDEEWRDIPVFNEWELPGLQK